MFSLFHHSRVAAVGLTAATLALGATAVAAAPAFADTFTSADGVVTAVGPTTLAAGVAGTYTVTFTNTTSETTNGIAGIAFDVTTPTGMSLTHSAGCSSLGGGHGQVNFVCIAPNLAPGASVTATFTEVGTTPGTATLGLSAFGSTPTSGTFGDSLNIPVTTLPAPTDVQVTGSSNNGGPQVGATFTYTFQVKDNGPTGASGVAFDTQLPPGLALAGTAAASLGTCTTDTTAGTVHCDIGNLNVGQQSVITFPATASAAGSFATTGTVTMTGTDSQPANNAVTVTVQPRS
ncbi:MAG: DUF11 domain-containing protein [Promicromonosporaceae bacterium]|nr:DUF11 domain-containing protein [Promicromonosporaceae bacterium]